MNISELWRKLHYLINRGRLERELAEELESHRAEMGGRAPAFGSGLKFREESNDAWGFGWFDRLKQDVHYGARILRKSPGFTLTAVAILALGIGLNVTAFGFFNTLVLRPLAVKDPDTMVRLMRAAPGAGSDNLTYPSFDFYRRHNRVFSNIWALARAELLLDSGEMVNARFVTPGFFAEMGGVPAEGRVLGPSEEPGTVVLSHRFWQKHFGGEPSAIGRKMRLNQREAVVGGVLPQNFVSVEPEDLDVWIPLSDYPRYVPGTRLFTDPDTMWLRVYGRLLPGVSRQGAEEGLRPIVNEYRKEAPQAVWKDEYLPVVAGARASQLNPREAGVVIVPALLLLMVLAAACANLGNLLLARGALRAREIGIRTAAGASRGRVVRQMLTESAMLALLGAAASVPLSSGAIRLFVNFSGVPDTLDFTPDWRVCLFALAVALIATILFGLAPALQTSRLQAGQASRTRVVLVTVQVAISCILMILSGLLTRGVSRALVTNPGFAFEQSANIRLNLSEAGVRGPAARLFLDQFRIRMSQVPGVESVGLSNLPPLGNTFSTMGHSVGNITMHGVDGNYFATMQIPILGGRSFRSSDPDTNIIVGERLAQRLWPQDSALGKEFSGWDGKLHWTIVGVAANAPTVGFGDSDTMELYQPLVDASLASATVVVRTRNIAAAQAALQKVANTGDSTVTARVTPMRDGFENRMRGGRLGAMSISALGGVALLVAVVGLAGLISYAVAQRTKEIGIRMALGARPSEAFQVGFAQLVKPVAIGMLIGIAVAAALAQALRFTLYGLSTVDPIAYLAALALFAILVALAAIPPLRRAARIDPATALRHD